MAERIRFEEVQRFRQVWLWIVVAIGALPMWVVFFVQVVAGRPLGDSPAPDAVLWAFFLLIGVGLPLLFAWLRLRVVVDDEALRIRLRPFPTKTVTHDEIASRESITYAPVRQYGGWGLRYRPGWGWAYNVSGDRGVVVTLNDGRRFLIGSQRPDELAEALAPREP